MSREQAKEARRNDRDRPFNEREERIPFSRNRFKLEVLNQDPDKFYYWEVDEDGKIEKLLDLGYQFTYDDLNVGEKDLKSDTQGLGKAISRISGSSRYGGKQTSYLMWIPRDLYEKEILSKRKDKTQAITQRILEGNLTQGKGTYAKGASITSGFFKHN